MKYRLLSLVIFELILENCLITCDIDSSIQNYYSSEAIKSFQKQWETVRKPYENALKIALIENFGRKSMNTIERKTNNDLVISNGFYLYDNVVHIVFHGMCLKDLPHFKNADVYFPLANNVLQLQTELSKMIVETKYSLMRNNTDVLFAGTNFDPNSNSPFALQQVQDIGSLAILVEDCLLSGFVITKLIGQTIVLGHDTFKISHCKFTIEISAEGLGAPPVIAPYFSIEQRSLLENLMSKPIREELRSKLQAALFSYINTSIFEDDLVNFRKNQQIIFKETSKYILDFIRNSNKEKMANNQAAYDLEPLDIIWNATINGVAQGRLIQLKNIVIDGFDSAYSPLIGGPYKMKNINILEAQRYNTLKVQGKILFGQNSQSEHDFSLELSDVTVNMNKAVDDKPQVFDADSNVLWRDTAFSITNAENDSIRITAESIVNGYVINEMHKLLISRILKLKKSKQLSPTHEENLGLERLSDISDENELERELDRNEPSKLDLTNESINFVDAALPNVDEEYLEKEVPGSIEISIPISNKKSSEEETHVDPRAGNLEDDIISNDEEGRRRHKLKRKKHKRHGKRRQHKSSQNKKGNKQKKKAHSH